jgi:hypothetical protein
MALSDMGVYQTGNPEVADKLEPRLKHTQPRKNPPLPPPQPIRIKPSDPNNQPPPPGTGGTISTTPVVDDFDIGVPPPMPSKDGSPVPASTRVEQILTGDNARGRPYSFQNPWGIQTTVLRRFYDENGNPYFESDANGAGALVTEAVTRDPGSIEAPEMVGRNPQTSPSTLQPGGYLGDQYRYNLGYPTELPENLNAVRRQIISVRDPQSGVDYEVGYFQIRYTRNSITITDFSRGRANAITYTYP